MAIVKQRGHVAGSRALTRAYLLLLGTFQDGLDGLLVNVTSNFATGNNEKKKRSREREKRERES
jgi:hypothetical protein